MANVAVAIYRLRPIQKKIAAKSLAQIAQVFLEKLRIF